VDTQHKDLVSTTRNLNNFTKNVEKLSEKIHKSFTAIKGNFLTLKYSTNVEIMHQVYTLIQESWQYIFYNSVQESTRDIIDKCHARLLSEELVPKQNLSTNLNNLSKKAALKNLKLAIPSEKLDLYYRLTISQCKIFTNNTLLVKINIPLIQITTEGDLYKTMQTPLTWHDKICTLHLEENIIFKTKYYTKVIKETDCNSDSYPLCKVPRTTLISNKLQLCLHLILNSETIEMLQKHCHFICEQKTEYPIITELLPNRYLLANVHQDIQLICDGTEETKIIKPITTGSLEATIPCNCELKQSDNILLTKIKPCHVTDPLKPYIINLIPASWTKLRTLKLFPLQTQIKHEFDNLSEIIDNNWNITIPTFQVSKLNKIEKLKLTKTEFDLFGDTKLLFYILLAWSTVLTIVTIFILYCLKIHSIQIRMTLPRRDYSTTRNETRDSAQ